MSDHRRRVFYGWWVVLTAAFGLCLGAGPIVFSSFAVFLTSLSGEFHSGRAATALAFTFFNLTAAISSPLVGRLVDRYDARRVILSSTVIFGTILLANRIFAGRIWELYVFYVVLGLVGPGLTPLPYSDVVSHWFDRHRGLALGLMMCGASLGAIMMPSFAQRLIAAFSWRTAYAIIGATVLLVAMPVVGVFLTERPEQMGFLPDGAPNVQTAVCDAPADQGLSWHDAWHSGTFRLMLGAFSLVGASVHACIIHMARLLADRGATAQAAALASSLVGGGMLISRLVSGYLLDRFFAIYIATFFFGGVGVGIALLRLSSGTAVAFLAAFLIGLGLGAEGDLIAFLTTRYFGLRSFGEVYGYNFAAFLLTGALGPYLMAVGFDWTGSYALPLTGFFAATVLAVLLMTRLGPCRYGVRGDKSQPILGIEAGGQV